MRNRLGVVRMVLAVIAITLMSVAATGSAENWGQYWWRVAQSDIVAVGVLSNVSSTSVDGYLRFHGDLKLESVVVGSAAPGETLRMYWERPDPEGPFALKTLDRLMDPRHEEYDAIGEVFPGVRVLWFLNLRDDGSVTAETSQSLISLSSDTSMKYAIEQMIEDPGPADTRADVGRVVELLQEEYARHPAVVWRASQRSN